MNRTPRLMADRSANNAIRNKFVNRNNSQHQIKTGPSRGLSLETATRNVETKDMLMEPSKSLDISVRPQEVNKSSSVLHTEAMDNLSKGERLNLQGSRQPIDLTGKILTQRLTNKRLEKLASNNFKSARNLKKMSKSKLLKQHEDTDLYQADKKLKKKSSKRRLNNRTPSDFMAQRISARDDSNDYSIKQPEASQLPQLGSVVPEPKQAYPRRNRTPNLERVKAEEYNKLNSLTENGQNDASSKDGSLIDEIIKTQLSKQN